MPSLLPGYGCDVFISYRQNDNRTGWVTDFVRRLQDELAAVMKEPVSIYFDTHPHEGIKETHVVDKSIERRLKCLVFIPILSQTYCDENSFAWKHEFCAFNRLARSDSFGREVDLRGGNVGSRILPVAIHDLDTEDKARLEKELGNHPRAIDFVHRSPGINRPLRPDEQDGPPGHLYHNQINKLANAIKETILSMLDRKELAGERTALQNAPASSRKIWRLAGAAFFTLLAMAFTFIFVYDNPDSDTPTSIAVLPFADMSPGNDQEHISDGLSEELINMLANVPSLEVTARTSSFSFKGKNEDVRVIAEKLNVTHILEGSIRLTGDRIRITAQLIAGKTGKHLWSKTFERSKGDILKLEDEVALEVVRSLRGTLLNEDINFGQRQSNPEALSYFLKGKYNTMHHKPDIGIKNFLSAIHIDSSYTKAWAGLSWAYMIAGPGDSTTVENLSGKQARYAKKAYSLDPRDPDALRSMIQMFLNQLDLPKAREVVDKVKLTGTEDPELLDFMAMVAVIESNHEDAIRLYRQASERDPLNYLHHAFLSNAYLNAGQVDQSELSMLTAIDLAKDIPWSRVYMFEILVAKKQYAKAINCIDDSVIRYYPKAMLNKYLPLHALGKVSEANQLLDSCKGVFTSISLAVAACYAVDNQLDSAFHYLRKAKNEKDLGLLFVHSSPFTPANLKRDPRYDALMRELKIID
jgi:adenylate cyclase